MDDTKDEDAQDTTNTFAGDQRTNDNDDNTLEDESTLTGASTTTTTAISAPSTGTSTAATSNTTPDSSQRSWTDSALVREKQGVPRASSSSSSRRTPTSATRRIWTNNSSGGMKPSTPEIKQKRSSNNSTGGNSSSADLSFVEEKRQLAHRSTQALRAPKQRRRRNDVIQPPTSPEPRSTGKSGDSSPVDSSFVSAKQQLAHRSSARNLVVVHQRRRKDPDNPIQTSSTLTKMAMMRQRKQENPLGDEEDADILGVLEYTGIIESQHTVDMAISKSKTSYQKQRKQQEQQQQQQQQKAQLQTAKMDSTIVARSGQREMVRRTQPRRDRGGRVWSAAKQSDTTPRNSNNRPDGPDNNNTMTPHLLEHAAEESDNVETTSTSSPHSPRPDAFNVASSSYIIGEETGEDETDIDFEAIENEVSGANPDDEGEEAEQRYRRDSSYSTGPVLALPVGPEDEVMQAQVVALDTSEPTLPYGGTESDGMEQVEPVGLRLQKKTNRMLVRFSIIFVLLVAVAIAIVIVVVSSSNSGGDDNENPETRPTPAPSEALPPSPAASSTPPIPITLQPAGESASSPSLTTTTPVLPTFVLPSGLTTEQESFLDLLETRSPTTSFANDTSPQSKALGWLFSLAEETILANFFSPEGWLQLFALVTIFYATGGESTWEEDRAAEWLQITFDDPPITECDWPGLGCDNVGVLVDLDLGGFGLTETLPPEVGLLTRLEYYATNGQVNQIGGTIPSEFGLLTRVIRLNLAGNKLEGTIPTEVGLLVDLEHLGLGGNGNLTGTIPTEISSLSKMTDLTLNKNSFQSTIPSEIGQLTTLGQLFLFENSMTGPLPTELGLLTQLKAAFWGNNEFSGPLPSELGMWTSNVTLNLSNNRLEGTIPTEFGQMTTLKGLLLQDNLLEGPLPTESLAKLTQLTSLNIASNYALTGTIPSSLCPTNDGPLEKVSFDAPQVTFDCPINNGRRRRRRL